MSAGTGGTTAIIFGNQLYAEHPALPGADRVLMVESARKLYKPGLHIQKTVLITAAMRHYAEGLRARGVPVDYRAEPDFAAGIAAHRAQFAPDRWVLVEPADYDSAQAAARWGLDPGTLTLLPDTVGFTCDREAFRAWAQGQKSLLLERFYRWQRERLGILMEKDGRKPIGGRWNFDAENREGPRRMPPAPALPTQPADPVVSAAIAEAQARNPAAFGSAQAFAYPVTHAQAEQWLDAFVRERLPDFGPWEDAMRDGDPFLFHGVLALLLNIGLLTPRQVIGQVVRAWAGGAIPLQSAEGFIRQVIGWREYVYGVYWLHMPAYRAHNFFDHHEPLPAFFWTGETGMQCLRATIGDVQAYAYTHHIPRLMLLANFGNLAGLDPAALTAWFKDVYIDAYDWVMWPNVLGLGLYADGGLMATKPYIAGAAYIRRMSEGYCEKCRYHPDQRTGPDACPFNTLYWDFLDRHRERLAGNPRMAIPLKSAEKRDDLPAIRAQAAAIRAKLHDGAL